VADFLVVSPHVDDEALGCGGILDERFHVHYCGVEVHRVVSRDDRLAEARACADLLGFRFSIDQGNAVNAYRVADLVGQLEAVIEEQRPSTVFLPCASYNQDHRAVLDAGLAALRQHDTNHQVANLLLYEQVHAVLWPWREDLSAGRAFQPTFFVPIDLERKLAAYRLHASQVRSMRSARHVETLARWRGLQAGCDYAEGFLPVRLTRPLALDLGLLRRDRPPAGPAPPPPAR
jgi:LmbE family N-acetylglucosaminyl deacetylase